MTPPRAATARSFVGPRRVQAPPMPQSRRALEKPTFFCKMAAAWLAFRKKRRFGWPLAPCGSGHLARPSREASAIHGKSGSRVTPRRPSFFDGRAVADDTTTRPPRPTRRTRLGAAPLKGQRCLDGTPAFVLSLFSTPSRRTRFARSFRTRRKLGRHRFRRGDPGQAKMDRNFFSGSIPCNPLISPDSGKQKEMEGNRRKGKRKGKEAEGSVGKGYGKKRKITAIEGAIQPGGEPCGPSLAPLATTVTCCMATARDAV